MRVYCDITSACFCLSPGIDVLSNYTVVLTLIDINDLTLEDFLTKNGIKEVYLSSS